MKSYSIYINYKVHTLFSTMQQSRTQQVLFLLMDHIEKLEVVSLLNLDIIRVCLGVIAKSSWEYEGLDLPDLGLEDEVNVDALNVNGVIDLLSLII